MDLLDGCFGPSIAERTRDEILEAHEGADAAIAPVYDVAELGLLGFAAWTRSLGFVGKSAIHPLQLNVIHDVFIPTEDELAAAQRIVDALREGDTTAVVEGGSVDPAVVGGTRATIELFERLAARR